MKCNQCGTNFEGRFCPNCGASVQTFDNAQQENYQGVFNSQQTTRSTVRQGARKPFKKIWVIIAVIVVIVISAAILINQKNTTPQEKVLGLNETAVLSNYKITATEIKELEANEFLKPDEGKVFIGVKFTIENTSKEEQAISSVLLFGTYVDDVKCDYSLAANGALIGNTLDGSIAPGKKIVGYFGIEAPVGWQKLELKFTPSLLSSEKALFEFKNSNKPQENNDSALSADPTGADGQTYTIGQTATLKALKVTANDIKTSEGTVLIKPENGKTLLGVQFTIENVSTEDQMVSPSILFDAYVDGIKCEYSYLASSAFEGSLVGTLAPGKKLIGYYAVEPSTDWSELELHVKSSFLASSKAVFIFNK